tara:strand:- start:2074 stop:2472 length:399 start_codon:yes stop_codon:yes gene_type:complete
LNVQASAAAGLSLPAQALRVDWKRLPGAPFGLINGDEMANKCKTCASFLHSVGGDVGRGLCLAWDERDASPQVDPMFSCQRWRPEAQRGTRDALKDKTDEVIAALTVAAAGLTAARRGLAEIEGMLAHGKIL